MLIILYCVLFNHNGSVCKGYRLRVTIYNDQIKRLVSKSIVPCTKGNLGIFKATMTTKGTDKHRAPLFRGRLILENFHSLINYILSSRRLNWVKNHQGLSECVGNVSGFITVQQESLSLCWAGRCSDKPCSSKWKGFHVQNLHEFFSLKSWEQECSRLQLQRYHQNHLKQEFKC